MYLSMWILADALKHYEKDLHIQSGKTCIRNASLLAQRNRVKPHTVYLMRSEDYIPTMQEASSAPIGTTISFSTRTVLKMPSTGYRKSSTITWNGICMYWKKSPPDAV